MTGTYAGQHGLYFKRQDDSLHSDLRWNRRVRQRNGHNVIVRPSWIIKVVKDRNLGNSVVLINCIGWGIRVAAIGI